MKPCQLNTEKPATEADRFFDQTNLASKVTQATQQQVQTRQQTCREWSVEQQRKQSDACSKSMKPCQLNTEQVSRQRMDLASKVTQATPATSANKAATEAERCL
jgi:hypothetical protein